MIPIPLAGVGDWEKKGFVWRLLGAAFGCFLYVVVNARRSYDMLNLHSISVDNSFDSPLFPATPFGIIESR